jgi:hypothetical protein
MTAASIAKPKIQENQRTARRAVLDLAMAGTAVQ